jgi:L-ascorbate metabolism protein UlaG (beta-lactamase superfamily)
MIENIQWLGHGSFLIQGPPFIYIDPWRVVRNAFHPDIILISHDHYDHCSIADVNKLRGAATIIIGNERVAELIEGTTILRPWQSITIDRVCIKAIPAYSPQGSQHPAKHGGLGYVISMNYHDIYYAGDTKIIPEMERVHPDIAILPIDNDDTLSVTEAVKAVNMLRPRWVVPCNWGAIGEGASSLDAADFKKQVGGLAEVIIPSQKPSTDNALV